MNPAKLILCLWASLVSFSVYSQNCITTHPNDALECQGTFVATSEADINTYMVDLGLNSNTNKIKNLKIDFDYTGDINLFSACKLIIENNRNLSATGTACLVAKEEVRIESGASLTTVADAKLYSANIVTLQANTNLDIGGTLEMVSTQATGDARVNIRSNTTLNVGGDLYMRALRQAKVGHHANITVGETFTIISNGETLSDEDSDWSSIAYDSVINAKRLSVTSYEKVSIGARTIVNTDSIYLNALDCKIGATSQINSITKEGNCFSGLHPDARFRTTPIGGGEAPLQLFINGDRSTTPTGNIVAYHWEFVGLGTVTTTIPTTYYTFNEPGTYRIRLQVENSEGLKNTTSRKIIVTGDANQAPTSSFIISDSDILVGESISVDASSSTDDYQIRKYHWNLSNGASLTTRDPIANFTFNEIGNVDISLIVEDFFGVESAVSTQTITVNSDTNGVPASAYFNVDLFPTFTGLDIYNRSIAGDGEIVELYYLVDGIRYDLYDFTYGSRINLQNISHDGDIEVSIFVTDSLGNQSSLTKTFVMDNTVKPIASFELEQSNSLTAYVKAIKSYDPLNDINSISIDWGDGAVESINPTSLYLTHQYLQAGDYNVTLTINTTRGESSSHTKTISIIDGVVPTINPTALFEVQKDPALGHVRVYVSESGTPNGSITGYSWQMGDGNVIEGLDQVAYFYDVGIYPVTLTITDSLGLTSSQTQTIVITENGDPLVISPQCSTNSNTLTADCVTYVAHRFAQFNNLQVDWGDGSVENFSPLNPYASLYDSLTHTYSEAGSYTATFYATAANGDTATVTREFYFDSGNMRPTGYISCNSNGLTVFCNGTGSYDPDGFITHYEFEVAQGNVIFSQDGQLSFTYPQAGTYEISLVAYDQLGLASIPVSTTITLEQVNNPPVAQLNCNSDSAFKVSCDAIGSYDSDGGIYTYEYIFYGDTTESVIRNTDSSFNYYFESAGNKRIDLIVTDDKGVSATTTINVDVLDNIAPIAAFSCSSDAVGELSCDGSSSSDSDGTISQYNWTINGQTYSGQVISVSGISATNVTVQLQVVDNAGATNMSTGSVSMYVNQAPVANFVCSSNNPQEISCDASSSSDDDIIQSYTWTINSQNYTGQNIVVSGILSSSVEVSLEVVDSYGETNQKTTSVNVSENQPPVVAFDCMSNSLRQISCTSSSTDSDGTIMEYKWTIDGINYFGQNINESLATGGNKAVTLHVTDNLGGTSSLTKNIEVIEAASPNIVLFINGSVSSYQIIEGQINFASSVNSTAGDGSIASREWFIDDVLVGTGVDLDISTYLAGAYRLKVVITNSYGISSFKEIDLIVATDVTPEFSITDITNYAPKEIQLTFTNAQQFVGIDTIEWRYFKEDKSFFGTSANFALNFLGNQEILLVVKDTNGATYTTELTVNVQNDGTYLEAFENSKIINNTNNIIKLNLVDPPSNGYTYEIAGNPNGAIINNGNLEIDATVFSPTPDIQINILDDLGQNVHSKNINLNYVNPVQIETFSNESGYTFSNSGMVLEGVSVDATGLRERNTEVTIALLEESSSEGRFVVNTNSDGKIYINLPSNRKIYVETKTFHFDFSKRDGRSSVEPHIVNSSIVDRIVVERGSEIIVRDETKHAETMFSNFCVSGYDLISGEAFEALPEIYVDLPLVYGINDLDAATLAIVNKVSSYSNLFSGAKVVITNRNKNVRFCENSDSYATVPQAEQEYIYLNLSNYRYFNSDFMENRFPGVLRHEYFHVFQQQNYDLSNIKSASIYNILVESDANFHVISNTGNALTEDQINGFIDFDDGHFSDFKNFEIKKLMTTANDGLFRNRSYGYIHPWNWSLLFSSVDNGSVLIDSTDTLFTSVKRFYGVDTLGYQDFLLEFNYSMSFIREPYSHDAGVYGKIWNVLVDDALKLSVSKDISQKYYSTGGKSIFGNTVEFLVYDKSVMRDAGDITNGGKFFLDIDYDLKENSSIMFLSEPYWGFDMNDGGKPKRFSSNSINGSAQGQIKEAVSFLSSKNVEEEKVVIGFVNGGVENISFVMDIKKPIVRNMTSWGQFWYSNFQFGSNNSYVSKIWNEKCLTSIGDDCLATGVMSMWGSLVFYQGTIDEPNYVCDTLSCGSAGYAQIIENSTYENYTNNSFVTWEDSAIMNGMIVNPI